MNQTPIGFLHQCIGSHFFPKGEENDLLTQLVPYVTKKNPEDGMQRLGTCGDTYMLASKKSSLIFAPLIGIKNTPVLKIIAKAEPSRTVLLGQWLWEVEAPFLMAIQTKAYVEDNLRISQSLRGGIFCSPSGIYEFDLAACRELADKLIKGGASKKYRSMQILQKKLTETPSEDIGMANWVEALNKERAKLVEACPVLDEVRLPWGTSFEASVLRWLIEAKELKNA